MAPGDVRLRDPGPAAAGAQGGGPSMDDTPDAYEPTAPAVDREWFYVQRGETYGPVSAQELLAAAHLGFLRPDDRVRRSDRSEWAPARAIRGLFKDGT